MMKYTVAVLLFAILVIPSIAESSSLNCGDLDPATCKTKFEELLDSKLVNVFTRIYKEYLTKIHDYYDEFLKDLPENDRVAVVTKKHVDSLGENLDKLIENVDFETLKSVLLQIGENYDPEFGHLNFTEEEREQYQKIYEKHDFLKHFSSRFDVLKSGYKYMVDDWNELFAQLRPEDLKAHGEYQQIDEDVKKANEYSYENVMEKMSKLFNLPHYKALPEGLTAKKE